MWIFCGKKPNIHNAKITSCGKEKRGFHPSGHVSNPALKRQTPGTAFDVLAEKAAYEEAEHAAKFAELLGEDLEPNMTTDTKKNLAWRVDCEFGATQGKFDLAACAKKNNLDAIHDTVHEMARDETRHGKALKGLLERYFK